MESEYASVLKKASVKKEEEDPTRSPRGRGDRTLEDFLPQGLTSQLPPAIQPAVGN